MIRISCEAEVPLRGEIINPKSEIRNQISDALVVAIVIVVVIVIPVKNWGKGRTLGTPFYSSNHLTQGSGSGKAFASSLG